MPLGNRLPLGNSYLLSPLVIDPKRYFQWYPITTGERGVVVGMWVG